MQWAQLWLLLSWYWVEDQLRGVVETYAADILSPIQ